MLTGLKTFLFVFLLGSFISGLSKLYEIKNNPQKISRHENGKINWGYCIFANTLEVLVGGLVALGAFLILQHFQLADGYLQIVIVGAVSTAAGRIFELVQQIAYKQVQNKLDTF